MDTAPLSLAARRGEIEFDGKNAHRVPFDVTDTVFEGRGRIELAGRLVLPSGKDPVPVVVLVHGAERESAREWYALQRLLPAENVGAFVYDKRGTGGSEGKYTQDFDTLADAPWLPCEKRSELLARVVLESDIRAVAREAGSHRSRQRARLSISLLLVSG